MRKSLLPLLLIIIIFSFVTCQASEEEKIHQVLNRRGEALQKKDLSLYLSCISETYQDKEEDLSRLQKRVDGYFKSFEQIEYSNWDRSIHIEGMTARAVQQFHLEVKRGGQNKHYSGTEALFLKKERGEWKIVKGL